MTLALGIFALLRLSAGNDQLSDLSNNWMPSVQHLGEMRSQLGEYRTYEISQLYSQDDPAKVADYDKRMADTEKVIAAEEKAYTDASTESTAEEQALYAKVKATREAYFAAHEKLKQAVQAGDFEAPAGSPPPIPAKAGAPCSPR